MIETVLAKREVNFKFAVTVKALVAAGVVLLAALLPQLVHLALGASGGAAWLPMYLPVLIGGCVLGWKWGLGVGILSPLFSFCITWAFGDPMPAAVRLPYMAAELAVFAAVSGAFSQKIVHNAWTAFPAVLLAAVSGRCVFLISAAVFQSVSSLTVAVAWSQIQSGLPGLVLQAVVVPFIVKGLAALLLRDKRAD